MIYFTSKLYNIILKVILVSNLGDTSFIYYYVNKIIFSINKSCASIFSSNEWQLKLYQTRKFKFSLCWNEFKFFLNIIIHWKKFKNEFFFNFLNKMSIRCEILKLKYHKHENFIIYIFSRILLFK